MFNPSLTRAGPGLLLRDIARGDDPQVKAAQAIIARIDPDILLLNGFDTDFGGVTLARFAKGLSPPGGAYRYLYTDPGNAGLASGLDLDGDGRRGGPGDAQGFGAFPGAGGMALLSRFPILRESMVDLSAILWRDLPGADLPSMNGRPFPSARAQAAQRLSSRGHWVLPVALPDGRVLRLLASHATPPVFDGPEDRNGRRNRDELRLWALYLSGDLPGRPAPEPPLVLIGGLNADPVDGEGAHDALAALLENPRLQDPAPDSKGAMAAARDQAGANAAQKGPARLDTVDWKDTGGPGNLRVDYVLPSADLRVSGAGVFWPAPDEPGADLLARGDKAGIRHRLVWVDLD